MISKRGRRRKKRMDEKENINERRKKHNFYYDRWIQRISVMRTSHRFDDLLVDLHCRWLRPPITIRVSTLRVTMCVDDFKYHHNMTCGSFCFVFFFHSFHHHLIILLPFGVWYAIFSPVSCVSILSFLLQFPFFLYKISYALSILFDSVSHPIGVCPSSWQYWAPILICMMCACEWESHRVQLVEMLYQLFLSSMGPIELVLPLFSFLSFLVKRRKNRRRKKQLEREIQKRNNNNESTTATNKFRQQTDTQPLHTIIIIIQIQNGIGTIIITHSHTQYI